MLIIYNLFLETSCLTSLFENMKERVPCSSPYSWLITKVFTWKCAKCVCVLGAGGEEAFFFNNQDIPASRYRDLGAFPSELRESQMKALFLHHVERSGVHTITMVHL